MKVDEFIKRKGHHIVMVPREIPVCGAISLKKLYRAKGIGVGNCGVFKGMITNKELFHNLEAYGKHFFQLTAHDVMVPPVAVCDLQDDLEKVLTLMLTKHVDIIPVIWRDALRGFLSLECVVSYIYRDMVMETNVLRDLCAAAGLKPQTTYY